jgi:hypothetical protein
LHARYGAPFTAANMMTLSFHAKPSHLVQWPGHKQPGQIHDYVGRRTVQLQDGTIAHTATSEAATVDARSAEGRRLTKITRRDGSLWPADKPTAKAAGVPFVAVELRGGEWQKVRATQKRGGGDS